MNCLNSDAVNTEIVIQSRIQDDLNHKEELKTKTNQLASEHNVAADAAFEDVANCDIETNNESHEPNNYANWYREDATCLPKDNLTHLDSYYSDYSSNEQNDYPKDLTLSHDRRYDQNGIVLVPRSSSTMHLNFYVPSISTPSFDASQPKNVSLLNTVSRHASDIADTNPISITDNFQPNMWHPNIPLGSYRSYSSQNYGQLPHEHLIDMFQLTNSGREARNRAEKNRRDRLNGSIQELSTLVPHVAESPRRVDKIAVLRFATHGLRLKHVFGKTSSNHSPQTTDALMKLLDSFFLTLTCNGQIVLVSSSVEQHLGHCQADLYGQNILSITHPEDQNMLRHKLIPTDLETLFDIQSDDEIDERRARTEAEEEDIDRRLREDKRSFTVRLARAGPRSEPTTYELIKIDGNFRRSDMAPRGFNPGLCPVNIPLMRRGRNREDALPSHAIGGNDIELIAVGRIVRPPNIHRSIENHKLEYKTRHLIDGRIVDCDQRISIVAGYMKDEVRNLSPFTFIHQDDVKWVIVALRQMYDCNSSYGESTYRLFTRNGKIIYLHTKGFLEIEKETNKVHSFICVNTLLDEEEGKRRVIDMKNKFSVIINKKIPQSSIDVPASENPQQLERAVLCLIQNLQKTTSDENISERQTASNCTKYTNCNHVSYPERINSNLAQIRCIKTPPLALVPPAPETIKPSIVKSVGVVKLTAAKHLRVDNDQSPIDLNTTTSSKNIDQAKPADVLSNDNDDVNNINFMDEPASHARKRKFSYNKSTPEPYDYSLPVQRRAIESVLSDSLHQLDNRLNQQLCAAIEIRDQGEKHEIPHTEQRIADIMKEHKKQRDMYFNITTEFELHRQTETKSVPAIDTELSKEFSNDTNLPP
ncbi:germ cell-expressed bHLH-PAS isoform 1-T18 [Glossina fuscipes fuscipes]